MKHYNLYGKQLIVLLAVGMLAIMPKICLSASSENYQITEGGFGAGGSRMSSASYSVVSTQGHMVAGGEMESENFTSSSGFVAAALPTLEAAIDIDPDTLNIRSGGKWITCYITLPEGYPRNVFDPTKVALSMVNGELLDPFIFSDPEAIHGESAFVPANGSGSYPDEGEDQLPEYEGSDEILSVKFRRFDVQAVVSPGDEVNLTICGSLTNGATFQGSGLIRVIDKGEQTGKSEKKSGKGK